MQSEKGRVDAELKGNTLRVYVYTLRNGRVGVREVQRGLGLSNPSLAQYHLSKLKELGLVREEGGAYEVVGEVKVDVMRDFLKIGSSLVPRFFFYAIFFTLLAAYLGGATILWYGSMPIALWLSAVLALASGAFWFEALRAWRSSPQA